MSSAEKMYAGRRVSVVEVNGGWTTILDGMKQLKVRNGELTAVKEAKMPDRPTAPRDRPSRAAALAKHDAGVRDAKGEPVDDGNTAPTDSRAVSPDLSRYTTHETRTASGRRAIDRADATADALRGLDLEGVYLAASQTLGVPVPELKAKYQHLNPGMQRMNLGNRMRAVSKPVEVSEG